MTNSTILVDFDIRFSNSDYINIHLKFEKTEPMFSLNLKFCVEIKFGIRKMRFCLTELFKKIS